VTLTTKMPAKLANLLDRLREQGEVRKAGDEWRTCCPAHADKNPSLFVGLGVDGTCILLNCKAGCDVGDIVAALDLEMGDLFLDGDDDVRVDDGDIGGDEGGVEGETASINEPPTYLHRPDAAPAPPAREPAGSDLLHQVYSELLALLVLADEHRQDLRRRGLDGDAINRGGYRTAERFAINQAVGRMKADYDDQTLL
jgi:hypothetical protein